MIYLNNAQLKAWLETTPPHAGHEKDAQSPSFQFDDTVFLAKTREMQAHHPGMAVDQCQLRAAFHLLQQEPIASDDKVEHREIPAAESSAWCSWSAEGAAKFAAEAGENAASAKAAESATRELTAHAQECFNGAIECSVKAELAAKSALGSDGSASTWAAVSKTRATQAESASAVARSAMDSSLRHSRASRKLLYVAILLLVMALVLLITGIARADPGNAVSSDASLRSLRAAPPAQFGGPVIVLQQGGTTLATRGGGLVVFDCETNMTCTWTNATSTFTLNSSGGGGGGCSPPGTSGAILYDNGAGGCADTTKWTTNGTTTITGAATAIFDASAIATMSVPTSAGAAPTADGFIAFDSTAHFPVFGNNGATSTIPRTKASASHNFLTGYTQSTGAITAAQPACGDLSDSGTACQAVAPANTTATTHQFFTAYTAATGAFVKAQPACGDLSDSGAACSSGASTTVNSQTCTLGSSCTIPFQTNGGSNTSQAGINLLTSTANSVGLTVTPTNSATNAEKFEVTGSSYTGNAATATSAAKWTTARNLAGNSVDGSANVAFANKFIVQGTADAGLSSAQFLGALGTGILKNTTTTGVLSAAAAADVVGLFSGCSGVLYLGADGACHAASGSGTVTVVGAGSLTSTALVTGGGTTTVQTPSATATLDSSGNMLLPGTLGVTGHVTLEGVTSTGAQGTGALVFAGTPTLTTPVIGAATGTSLFATGNVDGTSPLTITTGTTFTFGTTGTSAKHEYYFNEEATAGTGVNGTLPTAAAGLQYCVANANNGTSANTGVLTITTSATGQFIIFTDGTLSATGGNVTSGGAAADGACVVGLDSTHWFLYVQSGVWTKH